MVAIPFQTDQRNLRKQQGEKISECSRQQIWTKERCKRISSAKLGHKVTPDARNKISKALTGENNPNFGKPKSTEVRQKLSD